MSQDRPGESTLARHGRLPRPRPFLLVLKVLAATLAVLLVSAVSIGAIAIARLAGNIETVTLATEDGEKEPPPAPPLGKFEGGFNILIVGSDVCENPAGCGPEREHELADVTMLLHVSEDQSSAVAVSFPRDLVIPIPACPREDGSGNYEAHSALPMNNTLNYGGLACAVLTVEQLSGLDVPYAGMITFNGVISMSNAVGGVPVCVDGPIFDRYTGLNLPAAGEYTLSGAEALAFLRTRHGVGDGSDTGRISSQQVFLSSLVRTVKSDSTLNDPGKLFAIATAATNNMKLSTTLSSLNTMVSMALVLRDIPLEKITFVQYPGYYGEGGIYQYKMAPLPAQAEALFAKVRADEPFAVEGTGLASELNPNAPVASPTPTPSGSASPADPSAAPGTPSAPPPPPVLDGVTGQTAAQYTCSIANN